jgi:5-methylcytosine-specific restriction endonuclease McrA
MVHVLVGDKADDTRALLQAAKKGKSLKWLVPKNAQIGDKTLFHLPSLGFVARGVVGSDPQADGEGRYRATVRDLTSFPPVPLSFIRKNHKGWKWPTYPRTYTTVDGDNELRLNKLLESYLRASASPDQFNPEIDRYDERSVARLFERMWPDSIVSRACAIHLTKSIQAAHQASEACWSVSMFADKVRLNVGQVEALTLRATEARFLFRGSLAQNPKRNVKIELRRGPYYAAVPVESGACLVPPDKLISLPSTVREAHDAYIRTAAFRKSVSPFKASFSPAVLEYLEQTVGKSLPRPSYRSGIHDRVQSLPEEVETSAVLREGAKYQVTVNAYERDPKARRLCIAKFGTKCCICGFSFGAIYGKVAKGFIHVHHLRELGKIGKEYVVNPVADLRPVCPNCHAVLHRHSPAYSIADVRSFLNPNSQKIERKESI